MQVGQKFEFYIPQLNKTGVSEIDNIHNGHHGAHVFKEKISKGAYANIFGITRGKSMSLVTVGAMGGVCSVTINNKTRGATIREWRH